MKSCLVFVILAFLCAFTAAHKFSAPKRNGVPIIPCATDEVFNLRQRIAVSNCTTRGQCDIPEHRDLYGELNSIITINTAVHIMNSEFGEAPDGAGNAQVTSMMSRMNTAFGAYGIEFSYTIHPHNDAKYYCIPAYSGTNQEWLDAIDSMKTEYAVNPHSTLNIFVSCQTSSFAGTLFGIGTFPWDSSALTATGGLWLNSISVNEQAQLEGDITAEHETGHCLGLWHTFHGSDEVLGCNLPCEELPHGSFAPSANYVGDFCSDTPATPRNYACSNPAGDACNGDAWGSTDYTNYMGYGMDPQPCGNHFTNQQKYRMRCWLCEGLPGWVGSNCAI